MTLPPDHPSAPFPPDLCPNCEVLLVRLGVAERLLADRDVGVRKLLGENERLRIEVAKNPGMVREILRLKTEIEILGDVIKDLQELLRRD